MKPNLHNPYGYKVCYSEKFSKRKTVYFKTNTYRCAKMCKEYYLRYPPRAREDNHILKKPTWYIIPITKSEVLRGIWRECPF